MTPETLSIPPAVSAIGAIAVLPAVTKKKAPATDVLLLAQLKPCELRNVDEGGKKVAHPTLVGVSALDEGKLIEKLCSRDLAKVIENPANQLDRIDDSDWLVHLINDVAVRIERFKRQDFSFKIAPDGLQDVKHIAFDVDAFGFAQVTQFPACGVDTDLLVRIKRDLDSREELKIGEMLAGNHAIMDVRSSANGMVSVTVDPKPTRRGGD